MGSSSSAGSTLRCWPGRDCRPGDETAETTEASEVAMTADQLDILLRTSLELWGADAVLQDVGDHPLSARLALADGLMLTVIEAGPDEAPFRWWLRWSEPAVGGAAEGTLRRRKPCASTLGLLRTLRESMGMPPAGKIRIGMGAGAVR
jgi:hypothetical protein